MSLTALARVDDDRQPMLVAAARHPLHAMPVSLLAVVLLMMGLYLGVLGLVVVDVVALVGLVRWPAVRVRLGAYVDRKARARAAERLGPAEQAEWCSLEALARRTERFNPRRAEVDALLDNFLDIALALAYARQCAEGRDAALLLPRRSERHLAPLVAERARVARRAEAAIAALREQLERTEQLVRLACDVAIAEECEAGAELWLSELADDVSEPELDAAAPEA